MTSAVPVALVCPKPVRASPVSGLSDPQHNLFLSAPNPKSDGDEGLLLAKEISQIFQTRGGARPILGNRQSPGQSRRLAQQEKQPLRVLVNPMLHDPAFKEIEETSGDFPWD